MLSLGIVVITSITILVTFWFNTSKYSREQVDEMMASATETFRQLLSTREEQLITSAQLLTSDFGFKQAVASQDIPTIDSVLRNHSSRVNANLMFMTDLSGVVRASTHEGLAIDLPFPYTELIKTAARGGGTVSFVKLNNDLFQIVILPVRAPIPIAFTGIGFKLDIEIARELKKLTNLEVSFLVDEGQTGGVISTLEGSDLNAGLNAATDISHSFGLFLFSESSYISHYIDLEAVDTNLVPAVLSINLYDASTGFRNFRNEIFIITLAIFVLALFVSILFARNVSKPLGDLVGVARQMADGNYQLEQGGSKQTREVSELYSAFSTMGRNIQDREARIRYQAEHDRLTGLYNRETLMTKMLEILAQHPQPMIVVSLKVLNYRSIDDVFGQDVGDGVLTALSGRMSGYSQEIRANARVGTDEFISVLEPDIGSGTEAGTETGEHIEATVAQYIEHLGKNIAINTFNFDLHLNAGYVVFPTQGTDPDALARRATIAMEKSLHKQVQINAYEDGDDEEHLKRISIVNDLRVALRSEGQLAMHYQPKLNLQNNKIEKMEALIRWTHPTDGFVSPELFISLAEKSALISELTDWVIQQVVAQIATWKPTLPDIQVAINISPRDLEREDLLDFTLATLREHDLPPSVICFEMTERDMMSNAEMAEKLMHRLSDAGFELSIDDYGIGESSLSRLKRMPIRELKIDKTFITHLDSTEADQIIVRSTIDLAHNFGLRVIAEGVETAQAQAMLTDLSCDYIQGYHLCRPIPGPEVADWVVGFYGKKTL